MSQVSLVAQLSMEQLKLNLLTAMYCHPLLTRTNSASSSMMYAIVPTPWNDCEKDTEKVSFKIQLTRVIIF